MLPDQPGGTAAVTTPGHLPTSDVLPRTARVGGLRRRPTGAPPPLPRKLGWSGKLWLALAVLLAIALVWLSPQQQPRAAMDAETAILRWFAGLRSDWLTPLMRAVAAVGTAWSVTILGGGLVLALIVFKRWRHLVTFLVYLTLLGIVGTVVSFATRRPRPYGVTIIGDWIGFSLPSFPVAILAACLMGIAYSLVVPGSAAGPGQARHHGGARRGRVRPAVPRRRPSVGRRLGGRGRRRGAARRVPLVHPERGVPGHVPAGQDGPPRRHRGQGRGDPAGGPGAAGAHRARDQADRAGRVRRLDPAAAAGRRRAGQLRLREAVREEPRAGRPLVQARPDDPVRVARGRDLVPDRPPVRPVRGLHAAAHARREAPGARAVRDRRDHAGARVPDRDGVLRRRRRDQRRRGGRRHHRRGPAADPADVERRAGAPGHQARQPHGPRRPGAARRRVLRPGQAVAVAAGGRPRQHDARPRRRLRPRSGSTSVPCSTSPRTRSPRRSPPPAGSPARASCG